MHLVVFDIDGTLINTNPKDGECYWRVICELMGFSSEQPVSSPLYSVPMSSAIDASWGESEEATLRTLSSHRKLIDSLIEQRHGRIVNSAGDSVLAEFASVVNAVQCAVEIKTTLKAENGNIPPSGEGIPQFGINTDDVRVARQERQRPLRTALIAHFSQSPMRRVRVAGPRRIEAQLRPISSILLSKHGTRQREVASDIAGSVRHEGDNGRKNLIYAFPAVGGREVRNRSASFCPGVIEGRTVTFPARVDRKVDVARTGRRIIVGDFANGVCNRVDDRGS